MNFTALLNILMGAINLVIFKGSFNICVGGLRNYIEVNTPMFEIFCLTILLQFVINLFILTIMPEKKKDRINKIENIDKELIYSNDINKGIVGRIISEKKKI